MIRQHREMTVDRHFKLLFGGIMRYGRFVQIDYSKTPEFRRRRYDAVASLGSVLNSRAISA